MAPRTLFVKTMWINIYRSGYFHRKGKPDTVDRHAGDMYESKELALANIQPMSAYVDTVQVTYVDDEDVHANPSDSVPTPLSATRGEFAIVEGELT